MLSSSTTATTRSEPKAKCEVVTCGVTIHHRHPLVQQTVTAVDGGLSSSGSTAATTIERAVRRSGVGVDLMASKPPGEGAWILDITTAVNCLMASEPEAKELIE